jgi:hypothetical protein
MPQKHRKFNSGGVLTRNVAQTEIGLENHIESFAIADILFKGQNYSGLKQLIFYSDKTKCITNWIAKIIWGIFMGRKWQKIVAKTCSCSNQLMSSGQLGL